MSTSPRITSRYRLPWATLARTTSRTLLVCAAWVTTACSQNLAAGPCTGTDPAAACSQTCNYQASPSQCPSGYHCLVDGHCYAACTPGGNECWDDQRCTKDGRCVAQGSSDEPLNPSDCPSVEFVTKPVTPSILLVLDPSTSMNQEFGNTGQSLWETMKDVLINSNTGVVTTLQAKAYFGMLMFPQTNSCTRDTPIPTTLNNAATIASKLADYRLTNGTATGEALLAAREFLTGPGKPTGDSPAYVVLATDGEPNGCNSGGTPGYASKAGVIRATTELYAAGIPTVPLAMALTNSSALDHLQEVANVGRGIAAGQPAAPLYTANNTADLKTAFDSIINNAINCVLSINGNVTPDAGANGSVTLNGRALSHGSEWRILSSSSIELLGAACTEFKTTPSSRVQASFSCGVVIE